LGGRKPEPPPLDLLVQAFVSGEAEGWDVRWAQAAVVTVMVEWMGMKPAQVASELGCSPAQVRELHRTFLAFPDPSSRARDLSFRHHQVAARTADPVVWIEKALKCGWSTRQLEQAVREREDPVDVAFRLRRRAERLVREVKELLTLDGDVSQWLRDELGRVLAGSCRASRLTVPHGG
jgi:uncharacterized Ntn-hydrolase superfamily protein